MAKKSISMTLYMSEIIYDVQNKTYLTGRSRNNGNNYEEVANMQANDDDENLNQVMRSIGNAISTLKVRLSEYMIECGYAGSNELINNTDDVQMTLMMPSNYNLSANEAIFSACHQYVVNTAVGEWFNITNKADAAEYFNLAAANIAQIREALNKRQRPNRLAVI